MYKIGEFYFWDSKSIFYLQTDDKGVFITSLSQEYRICAETFSLNQVEVARLALEACQYIFAEDVQKTLKNKVQDFINKYCLSQ